MTAILGKIVSDIEFSTSEKRRLSDSFRNRSGSPFVVLNKYYSEVRAMDFWALAHKLLKIKGYRPGKAKDQILRRCLEAIDDVDSKENHILWRLYRRCVLEYMSSDLFKLDMLLSKESTADNLSQSTESIFREIIRLAPLYDVTQDQIKEFYEIWGFERYENFNSLFINSGADLEVLKRYVGQEIQLLQAKFQNMLEGRIGSLDSGLAVFSKEITKIHSDITSLSSKLDSAISVVRVEMQNLATATVNRKFHEVSVDLKKSISNTPKTVNNNSGVEDELIKLSERVNSISKKISSLEKAQNTNETNYSSNILEVNSHKSNGVEIFNNWLKYLSAFKCSRPELVAIAGICALKSNSILILDRFDVVEPLIRSYYQKGQLQIIAANPTWVDEKDWQREFSFLLEPHDGSRILIICDFEIPLQDAYLVPTLVRWRTQYPSTLDKIILIRGTSSNPISLRLFEIGLELAGMDFPFSEFLEDPKKIIFEEPMIGKLVRDGLKLSEIKESRYADEEQIRQLARNSDLIVQPSVTAMFSRLRSNFEIVLDPDLALQLALKISVLSWIEKSAGEVRMQIFEERLQSIIGVSVSNA